MDEFKLGLNCFEIQCNSLFISSPLFTTRLPASIFTISRRVRRMLEMDCGRVAKEPHGLRRMAAEVKAAATDDQGAGAPAAISPHTSRG